MYQFNEEKGSVMVEFALVSVLLITLLVGIVQIGLVFNTQLTLENAASGGARFVSLPIARTDDEIVNYIKSLAPTVPLSSSNITVTPSVRTRGIPLTVKIVYDYPIPVTLGILPDKYTLSVSSVTMQQ